MSTRVLVSAGARRAHLTRLCPIWPRRLQSRSATTDYDLKYKDKLLEKAKEKGIDLCELRAQAQLQARRVQEKETAAATRTSPITKETSSTTTGTCHVRRDSSPVKPLSSILNISKLVATPHTPSQISTLWSAYHASRSNGTGRGFISATLSADTYDTMIRIAKSYPMFVLPIPRPSAHLDTSSVDNAVEVAQEFYLLQWNLYPASSITGALDPFQPATSPPNDGSLPPISTVLFTPLQEYKHRTEFATPYLALTFYTDLANSHGIVLLRGEVTPSATENDGPGQYLLSQMDAQLLAVGLQKFYLWSENKGEKVEELLKRFHERPDEFDWRDLLQHSDITT